MNLKNILAQLNISGQCRKYGLSIWQCPQFLFFIMGLVVVISSLAIYAIGNRYIQEPQMVALIVLGVAAILFVIAIVITRSFERLAEVSRMKSEFVSVVSHQLRSPLSNLKWATELLILGKINSVKGKQLEYLKILKENNQRMTELVADLLTVSRIEQGRFPLKKEKIVIGDLLKEIIRETEIFARASNVKVVLKENDSLLQISADPSQLKLVLENLLDNAIRYTKEKGQVEISLAKKGKNLYFEIRDRGVGIPKGEQKYIFQKFFRSENALRHQTEGSGLGLYIAKSIIEKSGGKIGFKSQEGVGSTFWFTLSIK